MESCRVMARYANELFEKYIPDKQIEEKLLSENPALHNLGKVKEVNVFIISILGNARLSNDSSLEKFQKKILDFLGPLSLLWKV